MTAHKVEEKTRTAQRLVKNSIWLFSAEALSKLIALGVQILGARYLGDAGFGIFGFAFIATGVVINFIDNGLKVFLTRAISRKPALKHVYLHNIFALKLVLTFLSVLLFLVAATLMSLDRETFTVVAIIGFSLVVNGYAEMYLGVFRALEKMVLVSKLMVFQRILFFAFGFYVLVSGYHVVAFSNAFLISSVISLFLARWQLKDSESSWGKNLDLSLIRTILKDSLPICGIVLFSYIYFCIDSILLFLMIGKSETGWYYAAFKLIESLALLLASIRGALFPILSRTHSQNEEQFNTLWTQASRYLLLIGLPISAGAAVLAPQLINLLYGPMYEATGPVLQMMALPFFLLILNEFVSHLLMSADKTRSVLRVVIFAAVFNLVFNLWVIPRWGILGAAIVAGLTEIFLFCLFFPQIHKNIGGIRFLSFLWRPGIATIGMSITIVNVSWSLIPSIILGGATYLLLLVLLRTFNEFDLLVLRGVFNR